MTTTTGTTTKKTAARPELKAIETMETAVAASKENLDNIVKMSTEATQKGLEQVMQAAQDQVAKGSTTFFKSYDDMTAQSKETFDAFAQSSQILAKGAEDAGKAVVALAQAQIEATVATIKSSLSAASLRDVVELQTNFVRSSMDKALAETTKLNEMTLKLFGEAFAPIQARMTVAASKFGNVVKFNKAA